MEIAPRRKSSGYKYGLRDDFDFDFNDISRASTPMSTLSSKSEGRKREKSSYSSDDYKRKIARLKSELDMERAKNRKIHKEKSSEIRELRDDYESRRQTEIEELEQKLKLEKEKEVEKIQEHIKSQKDKELQQVLKYKDDEVKQLRSRYSKEKDRAVKLVVDSQRKKREDDQKKLQEELKKLKDEKEKVEEDYKKKCEDESKKEKEFARIKADYDAELRKILSESKKLAMGNLEKLKKAEKTLIETAYVSDEELDLPELTPSASVSQASSRAASRSVSVSMQSDPLKLDELNIDAFLASVTPSPASMLTSIGQSPVPRSGHSRSSSVMSESAKDVNRKLFDDKDRQLQKKVSELQAQIQRLERKIALLKTENETLKRKQDDKKPLEEKIKTLKKRNAELAAIARRLEEKAKHLQQENMKKSKEVSSNTQHDTDHLKKMFARQRAKDLAEHAKNMLSKDREIEDLRKKCQELADQLSNADFSGPENSQMYEEKEELVTIIKQAAKERLQLERQLAKAKPAPGCKIVDAQKYKELEETNETLKKEISKLERALTDTERLEIELTQKKLECERLSKDIETEKSKSKSLELELQESASSNTELTIQVSDLQKRLEELDKVNEECSTLRLSLSEAQHECEVAKGEVVSLQSKVQGLEIVVKNLEYSTERLKQVEYEYQEAVQKLQEKQDEINQLQKVQESAKEKSDQAIKVLQEKIRSLEEQCNQQQARQEELTEELTLLREQAAKSAERELTTTEIQTGNSLEFAPSASRTSSPNRSPRLSPSDKIENSVPLSPIAKVDEIITVEKSSVSLVEPQVALKETTKVKVNSGTDNAHTESTSTKSLDTGFAEDDSEDVAHSNEHSPEPEKDQFEDPELYEIAKKLKELEDESSDSTEDETSKTDKGDDSGMDSTREHRGEKEVSRNESRLSALAKKGPIQVFIAKYSYDPFQYSPNENPEAELPLAAGDYVLIYGDMDEDGFFEGELIDGRRGLVPSNFIEKVADEDISEFHAAMAGGGHHDDDSTPGNSLHPELDFDSSEETDKPDTTADVRLKPNASPAKDFDSIVEEINTVADGERKRSSPYKADNSHVAPWAGVPFPKNINLDRQLSNSIVISWKPPDTTVPGDVQSYRVFLDGDFKMSVKGGERTKALLENVDSRKTHRVSVRCISSKGQSDERSCTLLVGKDAGPAPIDVHITDITANSATVSWLPGNSNFQHAILVNGQEVRVVRPGVWSYTVKGLTPSSSHKVTVQARNLTDNNLGKPESLATTVQLKTLAEGLPDPPLNVQVESGPQEGTLLLTWLPVTIDTSGFSNGAIVTGYVVYADGRKAKEAQGPTNDHIVLGANDFQGFIPKQLKVRTLTASGEESADSDVVRLPQSLIKEITAGAAKSISADVVAKVRQTSPLLPNHSGGEEIDAFREVSRYVYDNQNGVISSQYQDTYLDSSCSELSDIPEVEEETSSSEAAANENSGYREHRKPLVNGLISESSEFEDLSLPLDKNSVHSYAQESKADGILLKQRSLTSPRKTPAKDEMMTKSSRNQDSLRVTSPTAGLDGEDSTAGNSIPAIQITRESSTELGNSLDHPDGSVDKGSPRTKSLPRVDSPIVDDEVQKHGPDSKKFSSSMDNRDGYRESSAKSDRSDSSHRSQENRGDRNKHRASGSPRGHVGPRDSGDSPRGYNSPRERTSGSPRVISDLKDRTSDSPREYMSPRERDGAHNSPRGFLTPSDTASDSPRSVKGRYSASPVDRTDIDQQHDSSHHSPRTSPKVHSRDRSPRNVRGSRDSNANEITELTSNDVVTPRKIRDDIPESELIDYDDSVDVDSISGEINPPVDDNRVRLFIALFDYDPATMSPNLDAIDEELPFREGQIIKVFGDKDPDGFYHGECGGRMGFVPCNMVSEIQVDDPELEEQLLKECHENSTMTNSVVKNIAATDKYMKSNTTNGMHLHVSPNGIPPMASEISVRRMVAMYDYDPQELSPNVDAEVELAFRTGDIVTCYGEMDDDGFYSGEINGQRGLVPSNFLQEMGLSDDEALESVSVISPARSGESVTTTGSRISDRVDKQPSPKLESSPIKVAPTGPDMDVVESKGISEEINLSRPRSLTPEEVKQKKKSGGFLSKGKSILKKFTR